jgi:25S rRNA (cytosine2278-C5)-methyltransferase
LIALPPKSDFSGSQAYKSGEIIFQDKASCFPAYLLDIDPNDGDIIDACAAPGNKTTHLAALSSSTPNASYKRKVLAFERDRQRTKTLRKMVSAAGADGTVSIVGATDFLQAKPTDSLYKHVTAILLDPSCSGSGIVGRDDEPTLYLPTVNATTQHPNNTKSKKRKRGQVEKEEKLHPELEEEALTPSSEKDLIARLDALSKFQLSILQHAMTFPGARKIVYSTCSVHHQENERVVINALQSQVAMDGGWRLLSRTEQVDGLRRWNTRGDKTSCDQVLARIPGDSETLDANFIADSCIRCEKGTATGTMGFFVAGFTRDKPPETTAPADIEEYHGSEEWNGFSDAE